MKDQQRDSLRKTILDIVAKGHIHYTDIEKKAIATCMPFVTANTFKTQFYDYLLANGYIKRVTRGVYTISERGQKLLEILP